MKRFAILAIIILGLGGFVFANTKADQEAVKKASMNYIEGFYEGDDSKLKAGISPDLNKHGFRKKKGADKYTPTGEFPMSKALGYTKWVRDNKRYAKKDSPKKVEILGLHDKIAITKATANWGVDYMLLAKNEGKWMIYQVLWEGPIPKVNKSKTDRTAAWKTGMKYIEGFYEGDESKLKSALRPKMYKFGYGWDRDKNSFRKGNQMTFERALNYARTVKEREMYPKKGSPKKVEVLDVMNHIAAIKVTAWWGIDYMLLSREGKGYMIEQIIWAGVPPKKAK